MQHQLNVYDNYNHWYTHILYKSLSVNEIHHAILYDLYIQITVKGK